MQRSILLTFCLIVLAVTCAAQTASTPAVQTVSADELKKLIDSGAEFTFVDVREDNELAEKGTLPNVIHIPVSQIEKRMSEIPKDKPIITACERGVRAGRAADALRKAGYENVKSFGFIEYREKGYPVVKPKPEADAKK